MRRNQPRVDPTHPPQPLDDEESLAEEIKKVFADPDVWLQQKHPMLGGRSPQECIDAGDEQAVWDLLRNIKYIGLT